MHVAFTANSAWNIAHFRRSLVRALLDDGHRITVLAPADNSVDILRHWGCRFRHLPMNPQGLSPLEAPALLYRFRTFIKTERPDIMLGFTIKNNIFGAMAARQAGIPFIPNISGLGTAFLTGAALAVVARQLLQRALRDAPLVFFQNADDRDQFIRHRIVQPAQARVLPGSGVDLRAFQPAPLPQTEETVFLMIARIIADKGVREFVEAARIVQRDFPGARFKLLGSADVKNRTAISPATLHKWQKEGVIQYLGKTEDVRPHIKQAHCIVLPSYREGLPRSLLEGAAMARPLIATDVPGCRQVVIHGKNGYLCRPRDAHSLAQAMLDFLALQRQQQEHMGQESRHMVEAAFDEAIVIAAYRQAIREIAPLCRVINQP